jgi:putative peptidoglycan lipid II flippase
MRSTAIMGAGTVASRFSGIGRDIALKAALGFALTADAFALANTLPNIIYILIIGGALNAVFVPTLVRHMKDDSDDGSAYADRLITLTSLALLALAVLAVLFAPLLVSIYATPNYSDAERDLAVTFARYCLPQIFFYGLYTMLSQVLNARGHFAMPMFAPIVNNAVAIATFVMFIAIGGAAAASNGVLTSGQIALLGIGTTLGVAAQAIVLIPVLRRAGYHYRPRFDWRGAGLGRAGNLAAWTIGLVLVNQVAYAVIVRLATQANVDAAAAGDTPAGLATYQTAHLMFILPHSVVTVSLVTALLPRMSAAAHERRLVDVASDIAGGMRVVVAAMVPASVILIVLGPQIGILLYSYGASSREAAAFTGVILLVFAIGLVPFSLYYVLQRGWYAMEDTRTAFILTVVLNLLNLAIALPLFRLTQSNQQIAGLALGYVLAYWITLVIAWVIMSRTLGGLQTRRTLGVMGRSLLAGVAMFVAMFALLYLLLQLLGSGVPRAALLLSITGLSAVGLVVYITAARLLKIGEVSTVTNTITRRLRR